MKQAGALAVKFCEKPGDVWAYLLFGEDEGVIADAANTLRRTIDIASGGADSHTLNEDAIRREPAILFDALEARSLLGTQQVIRIPINGERLSPLLLEAIALGDADPERFEAKLIISAGPLPKRSKLRSTIETARNAVALHFFSDETRDVFAHIKAQLADQAIGIEEDALGLLATELPGHRGMANREIEKLALYGHKLGRPINLADVRALSTTDTSAALHELIGRTLRGNARDADVDLTRLFIAGTSPISILRALQRETVRLVQAHGLSASGGEVGMKLRPPVFKNTWPAFRALMSLWSPKRLARVLERIYETEALIKTAGQTGEPAVRKLIMELASVAAQAR